MPIPRRTLLGAALLAPAAAHAWPWRRGLPDPSDPATTLDAVESAVTRLIPVREMTTMELATRRESGQPLLLLDVREPDEFTTSHIPGAIRLPPGMPAREVLALHGDRLSGATVVFYCAVGWRSGQMVEGLRRAAQAAPAAALFNLRGGIFRWHVEGRALAPSGATEVHQFDGGWGALLRRSLPR
jgi:rhodanese-related sulfurtransferase